MMTKGVRRAWILRADHYMEGDASLFVVRNPELLASFLEAYRRHVASNDCLFPLSLLSAEIDYDAAAVWMVAKAYNVNMVGREFHIMCRPESIARMAEDLEEIRQTQESAGGFEDLEPVA